MDSIESSSTVGDDGKHKTPFVNTKVTHKGTNFSSVTTTKYAVHQWEINSFWQPIKLCPHGKAEQQQFFVVEVHGFGNPQRTKT